MAKETQVVVVGDWEEDGYFATREECAEEWVRRAIETGDKPTRDELIAAAKGECYACEFADLDAIGGRIADSLAPRVFDDIAERIQEDDELGREDDLTLKADGVLGALMRACITLVVKQARAGALVATNRKVDLSEEIGAWYDAAVERGEFSD